MNSFLIRRLAPFFIFTLIIEFGTLAIQALVRFSEVDWSLMPIINTLGILGLTSFVSFLYLMIPYVLYLWLVPARFINTRYDKIITVGGFAVYVYSSLSEEIASILFWERFGSSFNDIAVDYFQNPRGAVEQIVAEFPIEWYLLGILILTIIVVWSCWKYLFNVVPVPNWRKRLLDTLIYGGCCLLAFYNIKDEQRLVINDNPYNNELAKEGTYSLFKTVWKRQHD